MRLKKASLLELLEVGGRLSHSAFYAKRCSTGAAKSSDYGAKSKSNVRKTCHDESRSVNEKTKGDRKCVGAASSL